MSSGKQVALVVGASRGIGRQVAIDLAKNGYKGIEDVISDKTICLTSTSGRLCKVNQRSLKAEIIPSGS
jgi:NAD(P)-dependent dehydrogenase (short-subunit alcohol dehydrogenase family)